MKIVENADAMFGPIFHKTRTIGSFDDFDMDMASPSAILGPAIYATVGDEGSWNASHLNDAHILTGYVRGRIVDLTNVTPDDLAAFGELVGRPVDALPVIGLEKRYGSVSAGLKAAGYAAAVHQGPGSSGKHIAVFDKSSIVVQDKTS